MGAESVGVFVAFFAGVLSFLSPCVLPLVPSYISFITGLSLDELGEKRWRAFSHALAFVSGFSVIFLALGASATQLGRFLNYNQVWLERIGGLLIVFFGLYLLGAIRLGTLARERRVHLQDKPVGYLGSFLVGIAFGAGWTPCIGPILGSILMYTWFKKFRQYIPLVTKLSGAVLVFVGVLLMSGYFSLLAAWLQGFTPDFLRERL
jgi:cytochrome c-type biogenesis protein